MISKSMITPKFIKWFEDIQETDSPLVGGKCLNLGLLIKAGFRVPAGFCVTTYAYRSVSHNPGTWNAAPLPKDMVEESLEAYRYLGSGRVAVRSSATTEDLPEASFAGQHDTFLNVQGSQELLDAIMKCWKSLWSDRSVAYRRQMGIADNRISMAVAVQRMLEPDSSGVMFSVSPVNNELLMIEASWGLGEAVVLGKVTPDSFSVDRSSLQIVNRNISSKEIMITEKGEQKVSKRREAPSLSDDQLVELASIGLRIEALYSSPQDIEWALVGTEFYILQSRPITTGKKGYHPFSDSDLEQLRQEEISKIRAMAEDTGTVWCAFNLSETLLAPLPMTWGIITKFMSGRGGFGMAYRELGFMPSKELDEKGVIDLICGRVYINLSREARLYFDEFPFEHNFEKLKENPANASYPQPTVNIRRSTARFWLKFPYYIFKMVAADRKMKRIRKDYDSRLKTEIINRYCEYIEDQRKIQLADLSDSEIISKMNEWIDETLCNFAKDGLKASILAGMAYSSLKLALTKCFEENSQSILEDLTIGLQGDLTVDMNQKIWEIAHDRLSIKEFLEEYGHRAAGEFELAQPRWREDIAHVENMVNIFREQMELNPEKQFLSQKERRKKAEASLKERLSTGKAKAYRKTILREVQYAQRYMPFREANKFYLMMGYELIRNALLELGSRHFSFAEDVFYLTPDELPQLIDCRDAPEHALFHRKVVERRLRRGRLLSIELPDTIFSDSLHEIGNPSPLKSARELDGVPISGGVADGEARVLLNPTYRVGNLGTGYILVCISTDPGWAPLFPGARGIVMERGGVLSHGAIVAREYGIPGVANVTGATRIIKDGQRVKVDGNKGKVFTQD